MTASMLIDTLDARIDAVLGDGADPLGDLECRAAEMLEGERAFVWECDARSLAFLHVGGPAEDVLGYARARWLREIAFWTDVVLHPADRAQVFARRMAETRAARAHALRYRARAADGRVIPVRDFARVLADAAGTAVRLRGVIVAID